MLTESQLNRINRIRTTAGRNAVTMNTAQLMMDVMSEDERRSIMLRISGPAIENVIGNVDKAVRFVRNAVSVERERCASAVENLRGQDDAICSDCAELAARVIRAGGKP